ncbi:hypothetical protein T265_01048 [Opisthorchis viverrini]|uniref:Uncharacterized protein n=1 Tax=Opisthorchis viverrini TaxID=6198 RepID=A0A075A3U8_OPIVI|nr:hypothetical protein T265_01048 [Opisthorchis viverrini]KER32957.1 hypothetical protein T265_01048 [Opisthorchis viverrini]
MSPKKGETGQWRQQKGGQPLTWQRSMKEITKRLSAVGATCLPGLGPRDPHCVCLETLQDMAANRYQWRSCCQFLSRSPGLSTKSWLYGSKASVLSTDVMLSMMMMVIPTGHPDHMVYKLIPESGCVSKA